MLYKYKNHAIAGITARWAVNFGTYRSLTVQRYIHVTYAVGY